jgi:hypothetical protein
MPCPFKLGISVVILAMAIVSAFFHISLSDSTLDYILQFVPLPESWKDRLYDILSRSEPGDEVFSPNHDNITTTTSNDDKNNQQQTEKSSTTAPTPTPTKRIKQRAKHQFSRAETPALVKLFKHVTIVMIVYLHIELIYYQFTSKCFAASIIRLFTSHNSTVLVE